LAARRCILAAGLVEAYKFKTPFYCWRNRNICYLNANKEGVYVGFMRGAALTDLEGMLRGEELKVVRHFPLSEPKTIDHPEFQRLLQEALLLEELYLSKK
jgi:hypothetical protein